MKLNSGMRRMDSMMIASNINIKKMSRLELLYTCVANMVKLMKKQEDPSLVESMMHYTEKSDPNYILYHTRSENTEDKIVTILRDAALLETVCAAHYDESSEYQLLIRVIREQTERLGNGELVLKKAASGMNSTILQNPADADAAFHKKAGEEHCGYIANEVELADHGNSIVVDYQFEPNIYSDSRFMKDYVANQPESETPVILVTDGGFYGNGNARLAAGKSIILVTTGLKGTDVNYLWADYMQYRR